MEETAMTTALAPTTPAWIDRRAYPFAPRFAALGEGRLHYLDEGDGPPVLFVHGTPSWSFEWRHLVAGLRGSHRCVAPDHLGFGLSDRPASAAYTPEAHAARLKEFVRSLGLREFTLVVHDFGGPIGLPLALDPDFTVERVVVLNSWMWSLADDPAIARASRIVGSGLGRWLYRWLNLSLRVIAPGAWGDRRKLTPAIHGQYLAPFADRDARGRVLWALARALSESAPYYDGLWRQRERLATKEVLLAWGVKDTAFGEAALARWATALPAARVLRVEGAGHWPHEEEPAAVLAGVQGFLEGPGAGRTVTER
jgi:haloalkane dehalogenase